MEPPLKAAHDADGLRIKLRAFLKSIVPTEGTRLPIIRSGKLR